VKFVIGFFVSVAFIHLAIVVFDYIRQRRKDAQLRKEVESGIVRLEDFIRGLK